VNVSEVEFEASDGWSIGAILRGPDPSDQPGPGVVTVPGSRHERDAWTQVASVLASRGIRVLQIDIRGRGASAGSVTYAAMGPAARRRVALDVAAAVERLAADDGVDADRLGLLLEQDTAADALEGVADDARVGAIGLLSIRHAARAAAAISGRARSVYGLVSSEDREGVRGTVEGYLAASPRYSRLDVFGGLGVGITMASVMQFEAPEQRQIDTRLAEWFGDVFAALGRARQ
jgi:hypothetical protein